MTPEEERESAREKDRLEERAREEDVILSIPNGYGCKPKEFRIKYNFGHLFISFPENPREYGFGVGELYAELIGNFILTASRICAAKDPK